MIAVSVIGASDRTDALTIVEPVAAGEPIPDSAIGVTGVSNDDGFGRIYVAPQREAVVGAVAVVDPSRVICSARRW
ncbi:MAG: hypothetical protein R2705_19175 [Ilumatobacteraceae bacterium]